MPSRQSYVLSAATAGMMRSPAAICRRSFEVCVGDTDCSSRYSNGVDQGERHQGPRTDLRSNVLNQPGNDQL